MERGIELWERGMKCGTSRVFGWNKRRVRGIRFECHGIKASRNGIKYGIKFGMM